MKYIFTLFILVIIVSPGFSQFKISENFEATSPGSLPAGWTRYNQAAFPIYSSSNWTVRDSGSTVYQVNSVFKTKAKSGKRSIAVSWYSSVDSTGFNIVHISDAWLVTPRFLCGSDSLGFFATGGSSSYCDSIQIWVNPTNTLPANFTVKLGTIIWSAGSPYGQFTKYRYRLSQFSGQTIAIGFRYYMNLQDANGLLVQLDDIYVGTTVGIQNISSDIPRSFRLSQNYPNPFNPVTNINFDLPKPSFVTLKIYDILGKEVASLLNETLEAGSYRSDFDASKLSSGTYFYRISTPDFVQTKMMQLVK
ncbi:hypothetical protein BH10BAC5_BH10BAC5_03010 [soil metagenome]